MKLLTYKRGTECRPGALVDEQIVDLLGAFAWYEKECHRGGAEEAAAALYGADILGFVQNADRARPVAEELLARARQGRVPDRLLIPLASVQLLAPLPHPSSLRDGYAFRQHVLTARRNRGLPMIPEFDQFPVFYFGNHQAIVGPGELQVQAMQREKLDYELEVAIVVGKEAKSLTLEQADACIFGMMIMNDWSARAVQMEEMKLSLGPAKGKDFATGLGPVLVTCDELDTRRTQTPKGAVYNLMMRAWVNEVLLSEGNLSDMHWTFAQLLERVSDGVVVYPGDVIGSGTVGTGCLLELNGSNVTRDQWLQAGDRVVLEVDMLGRLENTIVAA